MTCNQAREWIIDDLVVGLSPEDRSAFDEHIASCSGCEALHRQYRQLWFDLPAAAVLRAPEHGWEALEAKIRDQRGRGEAAGPVAASQAASWMSWTRRAAAAAALVGIGVLLGLGLGRDGSSTVGTDTVRIATDPTRVATADTNQVAADSTMPQFVLLFYEVPGNTQLRARVADEINRWARSQFNGGFVVTGAEMADSVSWAGSAPGSIASGPRVTHYLLIRALNVAHAERIAATAPVAAYGGVIEVRTIDP